MEMLRKITSMTMGLAAYVVLNPVPGLDLDQNRNLTVEAGMQAAGQTTLNGTITVERDAVVTGPLETMNGRIRLGENSRAADVSTVNGGIRLDDGAATGDVRTVNGGIDIGNGAEIDGSVETVNGSIKAGNGTRIARDVSNVNGKLYFAGTEIRGDLVTANGDVTLEQAAVLNGDLRMEGQDDSYDGDRRPRVVIGPGVTVAGNIVLERPVDLYISENARVGGVSGVMGPDDAVRFSGEKP